MTPKRLTNFRIDDELMDALETIRERDGIPVSEQVRRAIELWLAEKGVAPKKPKPRK